MMPSAIHPACGVRADAYDMGPMRIVVVSTEHCVASAECVVQDAAAETAQLAWLDRELGAADSRRSARRPWIVVVGHRPLYSSATTRGGDAQLRALMEPLIFRHGVDLAVWGHTQYERSHPVFLGRRIFPLGDAAAAGPSDPAAGPVHVSVGPAGGGEEYPVDEREDDTPAGQVQDEAVPWTPEPWTALRRPDGGFLRLIGDSACNLTVQYAGLDGALLDEFTLSQGMASPIETDVELIPWHDRAWDVWDRYEDPSPDPSRHWAAAGQSLERWALARPAPLGFGHLPATQISPNADAYFFRKSVWLSHLDCWDNFTISMQRDDGSVLLINGQELARSNMPSGPINFITQAAAAAADDTEVVSYSFNATAGHLLPGANVIAASVHQFSGSNDLRFDLRFVGRKRHPCIAQERYEASVVPEPQPVPEPEPEPPPPPPKPLSSDMVIVSATLAVCGLAFLGYVVYMVQRCTAKKVEVGKKQRRVQEVKVVSSETQAAQIAAKQMGLQMDDADDAWADVPKARRGVQLGGAAAAYEPGGPLTSGAVSRLKKKDLVSELRKRGKPVSGSTAQLQSRLLKEVEAEEKKAAKKAKKAEEKAARKAAKKEEKRAAKAKARAEEKAEVSSS